MQSRKVLFYFFLISFVISLAVLYREMKTEKQEPPPVSTGSIFSLSEERVIELTKKAELGDAGAAFSLYQYYSLSNYSEFNSMKWLVVSANLGHVAAQHNLSHEYFGRRDYRSAKIWAEKSKINGNEKIDDFIIEINKKLGE